MFPLRTLFFIQLFLCFSFAKAQAPAWVQKNLFQNDVFLKNEGQCNGWDISKGPVLYAIDRGHDQFQFTSTEIVAKIMHMEERDKALRKKGEPRVNVENFFVQMQWLGANPNIQVEAIGQRDDYFTYVMYDENTGIARGVKTNGYQKLIYYDLYPGIDLEYTIPEEGGLKYSLIVHPGADLSEVRLQYIGDFEELSLDEAGNFIASLPKSEFVKEHAPEAWYEGSLQTLSCQFKLQDNILQFDFPNGYDASKTLVIDPWVKLTLANFTANKLGYDVGYDNQGNLYVYGDKSQYKVAKYNNAGALQWTFNGTIVTPWWSAGSSASNFLVIPQTGKVYIGTGTLSGDNKTVRLSTAGNYDNFITSTAGIAEIWDFLTDCKGGILYSLGGTSSSALTMGIIDTVTGITAPSNITGVANSVGGWGQDIVCGALDEQNEMYLIFASNAAPSINNYIYKANPGINGNIWGVYSGYNTFNEFTNKGQYPGAGFSNGFNCLAVNASYLFYYDGKRIKAFDKATGAAVGMPFIIPNSTYKVKRQGGICVDECNNIYVGGIEEVLTYSFNGNTFTNTGSIPMGTGRDTMAVYDIKYFPITNSLYVSGEKFVGVYDALTPCTVPMILSGTVTPFCSYAVVTATTTIANSPNLTYTWLDAAGNKMRINSTNKLTDTITGLVSGTTYEMRVQYEAVCDSGIVSTYTFTTPGDIVAGIASTQDASCNGVYDGIIISNTSGGDAPYTYLWNNAQTDSIASNLGAGIYSLTVTDSNNCMATTTVSITEPPPITFTLSVTDVDCNGLNVGSATIIPGSAQYSYSWSGSAETGNTISNLLAGIYSCTISENSCSKDTSFTINQPSPLLLTLNPADTGICEGKSLLITAAAAGGNGGYNYAWSPGNLSGNSVTVSPSTNTTYSVMVTDLTGCSVSETSIVTVNALPKIAFFSPDTTGCSPVCISLIDSANQASIQSALWEFGDGASSSSKGTVTHCYEVPGNYNVNLTLTDINGCTNNKLHSNTIIVYPVPVSGFNASPQPASLLDPMIHFIDLSTGANSWHWNFGDENNSTSNIQNPVFTYGDTGSYLVTQIVTTQYGCADTSDQYIFIGPEFLLFMPNSFTPNGDNINDYFGPKGNGIDPDHYEMYIYDRWGNLIYTTRNLLKPWNGKANDGKKIAQEDTYVWVIKVNDLIENKPHQYTGKVSLIR